MEGTTEEALSEKEGEAPRRTNKPITGMRSKEGSPSQDEQITPDEALLAVFQIMGRWLLALRSFNPFGGASRQESPPRIARNTPEIFPSS
jgi:hypothetical protein